MNETAQATSTSLSNYHIVNCVIATYLHRIVQLITQFTNCFKYQFMSFLEMGVFEYKMFEVSIQTSILMVSISEIEYSNTTPDIREVNSDCGF